jgi:hypothetical protein
MDILHLLSGAFIGTICNFAANGIERCVESFGTGIQRIAQVCEEAGVKVEFWNGKFDSTIPMRLTGDFKRLCGEMPWGKIMLSVNL